LLVWTKHAYITQVDASRIKQSAEHTIRGIVYEIRLLYKNCLLATLLARAKTQHASSMRHEEKYFIYASYMK